MSPDSMCRVCLAVDVRLCAIAGTPLQLVYEKLTDAELWSDGRPMAACYICHAMLRKSQQLIQTAAAAEEHLTAVLARYSKITADSVLPVDRPSGLWAALAISPTECTDSPPPVEINIKELEIKIENDEPDCSAPSAAVISELSDSRGDPLSDPQPCETESEDEQTQEDGDFDQYSEAEEQEEIASGEKHDARGDETDPKLLCVKNIKKPRKNPIRGCRKFTDSQTNDSETDKGFSPCGDAISVSSDRDIRNRPCNKRLKKKSLLERKDSSPDILPLESFPTAEADSEKSRSDLQNKLPEQEEAKELKKKRKWVRRNACIYCGNLVTNFTRHLLRHHKNESEVLQYISIDDPDLKVRKRRRQEITDDIRNRGNFLHNSTVIFENEGDLIPKKGTFPLSSTSTFTTCKNCLGTYKRKYFYKHFKTCGSKVLNIEKMSDSYTKRVLANHSISVIRHLSATSQEAKDHILPIQNAKCLEDTCETVENAKIMIEEQHINENLVENKMSELKQKNTSDTAQASPELNDRNGVSQANGRERNDKGQIRSDSNKSKTHRQETYSEKSPLQNAESNDDEENQITVLIEKLNSKTKEGCHEKNINPKIDGHRDHKVTGKRKAQNLSEESPSRSDELQGLAETRRRKITHTRWTDEELEAITTYFKDNIKNKTNPGKAKCLDVLNKASVLSRRSWMQINTQVNNIYKKMKPK